MSDPSPISSIAAACGGPGFAGVRNVHKRYLIHVAGFNLGVLMRALYGQGTPREAADACAAFIFVLQTDLLLVFGLMALIDVEPAALVVTIRSRQTIPENGTSSTG